MSDRPLTILVVEDEAAVRLFLREVLEREGHRVDEVWDGPAALLQHGAKPTRYDLIILDLGIPGMDGMDVLAGLQLSQPDVRVLMCTGTERPNEVPSGVAWLSKPFALAQLRSAIERTMASPP